MLAIGSGGRIPVLDGIRVRWIASSGDNIINQSESEELITSPPMAERRQKLLHCLQVTKSCVQTVLLRTMPCSVPHVFLPKRVNVTLEIALGIPLTLSEQMTGDSH